MPYRMNPPANEAFQISKLSGWSKVTIGLVMFALMLPAAHQSDATALVALGYILSLASNVRERHIVNWLAFAAMIILEVHSPQSLTRWSWTVTTIDWFRLGSWLHVWSRVVHFFA